MYQNFIFEELNGTKHFLRWNPTSFSFVPKTRSIRQSLDGAPLMHYKGTQEVLGQLKWEFFPKYRSQIYDVILGLLGKEGVLYTNKMPILTGYKNEFLYSYYNHLIDQGGYWITLGSANQIADSSTIAPDGISMVYCYSTGPGATNNGYISRAVSENTTFKKYNVLSCYVKRKNATHIKLNMYSDSKSSAADVIFQFGTGNSLKATYVHPDIVNYGNYGYETLGSWLRPWIMLDAEQAEKEGETLRPVFYPHAESDGYAQEGSYMWGFQMEFGVETPTWYCHTDGTAVLEPMHIKFLDMQTEYPDTPGTVKHTLILNFKLIGTWT